MLSALTLFLLAEPALAQSSPQALKCAEGFLNKMEKLKGYSADFNKGELVDGKWVEEPIGLYSEGPNFIRFTFLKEGSSGVKNNGMQLIYSGTPNLDIVWGAAKGLGVFKNRAARAVAGSSIPIADRTTLKGEFFTLNRAGYHHIAKILRHHWEAMKGAKTGGLVGGPDCRLKYTAASNASTDVHLQPSDSVFDLEDRYGNYAFFIRYVNRDQFRDLNELFHRKKEVDIRIPQYLVPFEVDLDPETHLPTRFRIDLDDQKAAEYTFTHIKSW